MFRTLLVPLDGSELAERALPYATTLAASAGGKLVLVRVALAPAPATLDGATWVQEQSQAVSEAEQYLAGVVAKLSLRVRATASVPYGRAAHCILESITETGADAVVMATHGRTGLQHLLVGSVAEAVIAGSSVPVLVTRDRLGETPQPPFNPARARVVVPLDGSSFSDSALSTALELLRGDGELVLMCVVEPPREVERDQFGHVRAYLDQQEEAATREAREYLHTIAAPLADKYPKLTVSVDIRLGAPADGIIMAAVDRAADLVVMASHGRTGVARAIFGSVTGAVLRDGSTPVMVVHPRLLAQPHAMPRTIHSAGWAR